MQNTKKKLLSITNLKKYFPIAKSSVFQKEKFYVKANEDVSIDIYEARLSAWSASRAAENRRSEE